MPRLTSIGAGAIPGTLLRRLLEAAGNRTDANKEANMILKQAIGCIADDFTGASDVCSFLADSGASCLLLNGVPEKENIDLGSIDVVVVALKIRSIKQGDAIRETTRAMDWLEGKGIGRYYYKYCSTFDSTPQGNIGPVLDYLLERLGQTFCVVSPALPVNHRTVFNGYLYVGRQLLSESSMRYHPLNPMKDSYLPRLLDVQSKYSSYVLNYQELGQAVDEVRAYAGGLSDDNHYYIICDCFSDEHGEQIAKAFGHMKLLSGSSSLIDFWYRNIQGGSKRVNQIKRASTDPRALILSGSLSRQTQKQVASFINSGGNALPIIASKLNQDESHLHKLLDAIDHLKGKLLIYSDPDSKKTDLNPDASANKLEDAMATLARHAVSLGIEKLIVAGGETSGAVVQALGFTSFAIGDTVAPGVPILKPADRQDIQLVLKSGNFGQDDFFNRAISLMEEKTQ